MSRHKTAFLFDLDGTLIDSAYQHVLAWKTSLDAEGINIPVWKIHRKIGMSGGLFANILLRETGLDNTPERLERLRNNHAAAYKRLSDSVRPLPGARETGPRREARTHYRRLATVEVPIALGRYPQQRYAWMLALPETGRFRQIRKHFAHIHHPVIGDSQHGRSDHNRLYRQHFGCHRLLLHAWQLDFRHPRDARAMRIEAPLDAAFANLLARFGWSVPVTPDAG